MQVTKQHVVAIASMLDKPLSTHTEVSLQPRKRRRWEASAQEDEGDPPFQFCSSLGHRATSALIQAKIWQEAWQVREAETSRKPKQK